MSELDRLANWSHILRANAIVPKVVRNDDGASGRARLHQATTSAKRTRQCVLMCLPVPPMESLSRSSGRGHDVTLTAPRHRGDAPPPVILLHAGMPCALDFARQLLPAEPSARVAGMSVNEDGADIVACAEKQRQFESAPSELELLQ